MKSKKLIIIKISIIILLSLFLTAFELYYSTGHFPLEMFYSYFNNFLTILLNFLPILLIMLLFYMVFNKLSLSFMCTSFLIIPLTIANYFKLALRDDPLLIEDFQYIKEALNMQQKYSLVFRKGMYIAIIFSIIITLLLYFFLDKKCNKNKKNLKYYTIRISSFIIILISGIFSFNKLYLNNTIYEKLSNTNLINIWSTTQQYISRGFIYSFLNSYKNLDNTKPDFYNKNEAINYLSQFKYTNIEDDKKVNVISIMLEAYNDFSKFDSISFKNNPYSLLETIRNESYYGELCTEIFGGGTISTERRFLTGYFNLSSCRKNTNSFVHYFYEQGYKTEGSHTSYSWFYNRKNINKNLGFNNYYFHENKYRELVANSPSSASLDETLFNEILNLYNENKYNPYFSFNVTYQNHGPYTSRKEHDISYVENKDNYFEEGINIFNNYLYGIDDTTKQVYNMIKALENDDTPCVLIVFGDHNPWLGDNNSVYDMLGINLNLDTEEGFYNYYCTPYIIWANNAAKETLGNDFIGNGPTISPSFLMSEFFELAGYTGNEYMQINTNMKNRLNIIHSSGRYFENNCLTNTISNDAQKQLNEFYNVEYYYSHNFIKNNR